MESFFLTEYINFRQCVGQYPSSFIRNFGAVKVDESDDSVTVAISSGQIQRSQEHLENFHAPKKLVVISVSDRDFSEFVGSHLNTHAEEDKRVEKTEQSFALEEFGDTVPVVAIINAIFLEAIRKKASDIHIEPTATHIIVRFRLDGVLQLVRELDKNHASALSSRIKIMAELNIMESRLPQDGRMQVTVEGIALDFRVSIIPVTLGESIVLRLFDTNNAIVSLDVLGLNNDHVKELVDKSHLPNGLILVTGPTGSGKTTTLHSMLHEMDVKSLKIITIEDPVERVLDGINQIQINDEIAVSFDTMLRRVLRQDPNVIMVGEIRDAVTAELAVRSSLTGHLILSTLHTNDSISAITRLENMGLQRYLIASVLRCVLAQRLVRKVCPFCAKEESVSKEFLVFTKKYSIQVSRFLIGQGCEKCNHTGYSGRTAVSELFSIDDTITDMIATDKSIQSIRAYAQKQGMISLEEDAVQKVCDGVTTYSEVKREAIL